MEERTYLSGTSLAGMSPTRSRVENDYYATPFEATEAILSREELHGSILEPAAGEGHISKFKFPSPIPLKKALVDMLEDKVDERYYLPDDKVAAMITPPFRQISNTVRTSGRGSTDHHCWDLLTCRCEAE